MTVGADGLDWDFIKQFAALPASEQAKLTAQAGKKKTPPTPIGVRIPETPLPADTIRLGGGLAVETAPAAGPDTNPSAPAAPSKSLVGDREGAGVAESLLRQFGLEELLSFVDQIARGSLTYSQLAAMLYDPTSDPGKVVDRLYPEIQLLRKAGKEPMTIPQIQQFKATSRDVFQSAGVPADIYASNDLLTKYIVGNVGLPELQERAAEYANYGARLQAEASPEVRNELEGFERFYNVKLSPGEVAAVALNADIALPVLKQRFKAVDTNADALRAGYGALGRTEAESLAALGLSDQQAQQGFSTLAGLAPITAPTVGQENSLDTISRADQQAAVLKSDAGASRRIEQNRQKILSPFQQGGQFANGQEGFVGTGNSRGR